MSEEEVEDREPLLQHLRALSKSVQWAILCLIVGSAGGYIFSEEILIWVRSPYDKVLGSVDPLVFISPFEKIWVHLRLAFWGGFVVMLPAIYASLYPFFKPALLPRERRWINLASIAVFAAFAVGIFLGQSLVIELLLKALLSFKESGENALISLSAYVDMSLGVMLACALLLEIPILMFLLTKLGWVSCASWRKGRRIALVVNSVLAAFLSPPDVVSMVVLMLPIQVLYECGILTSRVAEWGQHEEPSTQ